MICNYKNFISYIYPDQFIEMKENWLEWAMRLQSIAQAGLTYGETGYDIERYQQIRTI